MTQPQPFHNFDRQEAFDTMVNHLRKQGKPALKNGDWCAYRGAEGTKCAVGVLIPDEAYDLGFEGDRLETIVGELGGNTNTYEFLREAQLLLHDNPYQAMNNLGDTFMAGMEIGARKLALQCGLTYTPPEETV